MSTIDAAAQQAAARAFTQRCADRSKLRLKSGCSEQLFSDLTSGEARFYTAPLGKRSIAVAQVRRTEAVGDQCRDSMAFDRAAVAARAQYLDISPRQLRCFEDRLPAAAAGRADHRPLPARHRDSRDLVEPEGVLRGG